MRDYSLLSTVKHVSKGHKIAWLIGATALFLIVVFLNAYSNSSEKTNINNSE